MDQTQMKEKIESILQRNPFSQLLGLEILDIQKGYAKGRILLEKRLKNVHGGMHGGCSYALADTLCGVASSTYGNYTTTVNGSINYLKPICNTKYVYCEVNVVRQGGTIGVYEANITDDTGDLLAVATFTYYRTGKLISEP
ncbi:MAG: PaaI family thioesterase [Lachnospiraceae bacterium]|nr:PaaI family thioesterase [Lachnospiraceae bacterium]